MSRIVGRAHLSLALAFSTILVSCATLPSIRSIPPEMTLESQKHKTIIKASRQFAEVVINATNSSLIRLGDQIDEPYRKETAEKMADLRQAMKGDNEDEIYVKGRELLDRWERLNAVDVMIRQTTYLPFDLGDMISQSLMLQLITELQVLQNTTRSESRNAIENRYEAVDRKITVLREYRDIMGNIAKLGLGLGPALRGQILRALEPLQQAMRGDSWDDVLAKQPLLAIGYSPKYLVKYVEDSERGFDSYDLSDKERYLSARQELYVAMQGENWDAVMEKASTLLPKQFGDQSIGSCVRVLSIDGGGIRGIIPAIILAEIEKRTDKRIAELFDLIVGTSTGGILALGLAMPDAKDPSRPAYTAKKLVKFYMSEGRKIFPADPLKGVRQALGAKYSPKGIEEVLEFYFKNTYFGDALTNVAIPAYEIEWGQHFYFLTYMIQMQHVYMREVARAASAAPTYFPPVRVPIPMKHGDQVKEYAALIDGGVFANSPSSFAMLVANYFEYEQKKIPRDTMHPLLLLSLGTGKVTLPRTFEDVWNWRALQWLGSLLDIAFSDPGLEDEIDVHAQSGDYSFRFQAVIPTTETEASQLDNASTSNLQKLKSIAEKLIDDKKTEINQLVEQLLKKRPADCKRIVGPFVDPSSDWAVKEFKKEVPYVGY